VSAAELGRSAAAQSLYLYVYVYVYIYIHVYTAGTYESCKTIYCPAPPIRPLGAGTYLAQDISARSYLSGGNEKANRVE